MRKTILSVVLALAAPAVGQTGANVPSDDPRVTPVVRAYRRVRPAVVNISTEKVVTTRRGFGQDPFEDIFPSPFTRRVPVQSLGSGVLIDGGGYVVTNAHVVRRARSVSVSLQDGTQFDGRVISAAPEHDLAVLKIDPGDEDLPHLPPGRSDDLMVGEPVIAIGNPLGYANSLTTGVVSAVDRTLEFRGGVRYEGLIQTDAPINPGNSGGPLLNIKGELIGINTAIRADAQNIGFAIPIGTVIKELPDMLDFERINRVEFGAKVVQRCAADRREVVVAEVRQDTPADGKLTVGDRVVGVNGSDVEHITDFTCEMLSIGSDEPVEIRVLRDGREVTATVRLRSRPIPDGRLLAERVFGLTLRDIDAEAARELRLPTDRGLLVVGVEQGSVADRVGIRLKDILFQVNRYYVDDTATLGEILENVQPGEVVRAGILRGNVAVWTNIRAEAGEERQGI
ncbi:MAG: trypsin-like peptidase domain-containing protein [Planctomycetota bacterium]